MKMNVSIKTAIILLLATSATWAGEKYENGFIGYRGNGRGVYPPDCRPVTEWKEWDYKKGEYTDHRGRTRTDMLPDKRNPSNIVWKVPQRTYCNGGMLVAGGKLYMLADRGGVGFSREYVPDFLGGKLICMDPADGKTLWTRDLTHFDKLDPKVAEKVKADLEELVAWYPRTYSAFLEFRKVAGPLLGGGHGMPNYHEKMPQDYEQKYAEAAKKVAEIGRVPLKPKHFSVIAGDHLFGMEQDGRCIVIKIGREPKVVGVSRLGDHGPKTKEHFNQGSQPFFSGNRIFMRSYTDVYSIGKPDAPMKLSEVHK